MLRYYLGDSELFSKILQENVTYADECILLTKTGEYLTLVIDEKDNREYELNFLMKKAKRLANTKMYLIESATAPDVDEDGMPRTSYARLLKMNKYSAEEKGIFIGEDEAEAVFKAFKSIF